MSHNYEVFINTLPIDPKKAMTTSMIMDATGLSISSLKRCLKTAHKNREVAARKVEGDGHLKVYWRVQ